MQYSVIEFFQSETEKERRRNLERLLQQLRPINGPKDGGTDAPVEGLRGGLLPPEQGGR